MTLHIEVDQIIRAERKFNTPSGNPRFVLHTSEGAWPTKPDAAVNYSIEPATETLFTHRVRLEIENSEVVGMELLS